MRNAKARFGDNYPKKFGGAAAIEILRAASREEGIMTSRRDVFVKGFHSEIDLIVPQKNAAPWLDLLYEPQDVSVALEVKKIGSFGEQGRDKIKRDFAGLKGLGVKCAYVHSKIVRTTGGDQPKRRWGFRASRWRGISSRMDHWKGPRMMRDGKHL